MKCAATVYCQLNMRAKMNVQLMVPRSEVTSELEEQGIDVAALEEELCIMARNLVTAAQSQVLHHTLLTCLQLAWSYASNYASSGDICILPLHHSALRYFSPKKTSNLYQLFQQKRVLT